MLIKQIGFGTRSAFDKIEAGSKSIKKKWQWVCAKNHIWLYDLVMLVNYSVRLDKLYADWSLGILI